jgi:hypothetical protein
MEARAVGRLSLRALGAVALAGLLAVVVPAGARAESGLWTLTASPLAATTGVSTTFSLTATNEDPLSALTGSARIGCVVVTLPGNFTVAASVVTGSNAGGGWHVDSIDGNTVTVHTDSGGDRLQLLEWVRFDVNATAWSTGSLAWTARAYQSTSCSGMGALLGVPPIVVVSGPSVTPTPLPTPTPTPVPTPSPTPRPTATPIIPLPSISVPPLQPTPAPTARPDEPVATPRPAASPTAEPAASARATSASPSPTPTPTPDATPAPGSAPSGGAGTDPIIRLAAADPAQGGELALAPLDVFAGATVFAVPAAALGGPGILILLWVAAQTLGAATWIPAVRRLRGRDHDADAEVRLPRSTVAP